jgi:hypothetical protein
MGGPFFRTGIFPANRALESNRKGKFAMKNVSGEWAASQSNDERVRFDLRQDPNGNLSGTALNKDGTMQSVHLEGRVTDSDFLAIVTWNTGAVGEYNGRFGLQFGQTAKRRLTGVSFDRNDVTVQASWFSEDGFLDVKS